jgi:DNA-directed RNA polymerase specialized sigma subunit
MPQERRIAELLSRACLGDTEARLLLVKEYLDLVVQVAAVYASRTGRPFSQMVQVGTIAVIRAVEDFHCSQQMSLDDHVKFHVVKAMEEITYV